MRGQEVEIEILQFSFAPYCRQGFGIKKLGLGF